MKLFLIILPYKSLDIYYLFAQKKKKIYIICKIMATQRIFRAFKWNT